MKVNSNTWHARLYKNWYKRKYEQEHNGSFTNLCPYMRAVMFWSWMRPLFMTKWWNLIPITFLLIAVPRWLGIVSYQAKISVYYLYLLTIGGTFVCWCLNELDEKGTLNPVETFSSLVEEYGRSAHDRVCPEIEFN